MDQSIGGGGQMGRGGTIKPFHDLILAWQPDLPPGLPAYVNPHIEHSQNVNLEIFYISGRRGKPSRFADYLAEQLQGGGGVSSVGFRDTVCRASTRFMPHSKSFAPVQRLTSLFLYFKLRTFRLVSNNEIGGIFG